MYTVYSFRDHVLLTVWFCFYFLYTVLGTTMNTDTASVWLISLLTWLLCKLSTISEVHVCICCVLSTTPNLLFVHRFSVITKAGFVLLGYCWTKNRVVEYIIFGLNNTNLLVLTYLNCKTNQIQPNTRILKSFDWIVVSQRRYRNIWNVTHSVWSCTLIALLVFHAMPQWDMFF